MSVTYDVLQKVLWTLKDWSPKLNSLQVAGDTATGNITTNTANIATNTANIATNTTNITALQAINQLGYNYQDSTVINTTSTSLVDMTSVTLPLTVKTGDLVYINFIGNFSQTLTTNNVYIRLFRSAIGLTFESTGVVPVSGTGGDKFCIGLNYVDSPTTGTYNYKIQWRTSANTAYCGTKCFSIMHLKKS